MKVEDAVVDAADEDDKVKTSASQNCATATLCTWNSSSGLSIYSSPLLSAERCGGQHIDGQHNTLNPTSILQNRVYETYMNTIQSFCY